MKTSNNPSKRSGFHLQGDSDKVIASNYEAPSFSTEQLLFKLEEELDTSDLYYNGKKLRILKDLIEK